MAIKMSMIHHFTRKKHQDKKLLIKIGDKYYEVESITGKIDKIILNAKRITEEE